MNTNSLFPVNGILGCDAAATIFNVGNRRVADAKNFSKLALREGFVLAV